MIKKSLIVFFVFSLMIFLLGIKSLISYEILGKKKIILKKVTCREFFKDSCPIGMCFYNNANGRQGGPDIAYWMCAIQCYFDQDTHDPEEVMCAVMTGPGPNPNPNPIPLY